MLGLPQRQSLEKQTAALLREQIAGGAWRTWLPGERALGEMLQVSRYTLRAALRSLQNEGLIRPEHGAGNRILKPASRSAPRPLASRDVGLLVSGPLDQLSLIHILWIDQLRALLGERGCRLHLFHGRQYAHPSPGRTLQRLVAQHPHGCWILVLSSSTVQRWFHQHEIPCLVAGSVHEGIDLPYRDIDHRSICRHAAGFMLGRGHRKIALLVQKSRYAGDLESELGFAEGVHQSPHPDATFIIGHHESTAANITHAVRRLMSVRPAPTALLVMNPFHYLTVMSCLARLSLRVPEDVSLMSRDGEPYFSFLLPAPAHYAANPRLFAKALLAPVLQLLAGDSVTQRALNIMPSFVKGASISQRDAA
jgi:DNA-binding LacI/PurR family transcriptional regulator